MRQNQQSRKKAQRKLTEMKAERDILRRNEKGVAGMRREHIGVMT